MGCEQDVPTASNLGQQLGGAEARLLRQNHLKRVYNRIARDKDRGFADALLQEQIAISPRGRKMVSSQLSDPSSVKLLRIRTPNIAGTQSGLDVRDRNAKQSPGCCAGQGRCRIALYDDQVRRLLANDRT